MKEKERDRSVGARITIILDPSVPGVVAKVDFSTSFRSLSLSRTTTTYLSLYSKIFPLLLGEAYNLRSSPSSPFFFSFFFNLLYTFLEFFPSHFSNGAPRLLAIILLALFVSFDCSSFSSTRLFFCLFSFLLPLNLFHSLLLDSLCNLCCLIFVS